MEQKKQITNVEELVDWITTTHRVQAPNNADVFINIKKDDNIDDIIFRTIERFEDFDIDERFTELWDKNYPYSPSQFLRILKEDEENFRELAEKLAELKKKY
jgi:hypothetical protein